MIVIAGAAFSEALVEIGRCLAPTRLVTSTASTPITFTEGPLADGTGGVFFSNMLASSGVNGPSQIMRYDIGSGALTIPVTNSGGTNGTYHAANGDVIAAEAQNRRIGRRTETNGVLSTTSTSIVSAYVTTSGSKAFNGPNDLVVDSTGGIYFTDPDYEGRHSLTDAFYYYSSGGVLTQLGTFGTGRPNGIVLSPDGSTLYLALEQQFKIMAYDVTSPGVLTNARNVRTTSNAGNNGPDGLTVDAVGNVYAAMYRSVVAWSPVGTQLFNLPMPTISGTTEDPTNVEFGGADNKTLFITAGVSLYGVHLNVASLKPGDFDQDGILTTGDISAMMSAMTDMGSYETAKGFNASQMTKLGDVNNDGSFNNADLQYLLDALKSGGVAGGSVPEPASLTIALLTLSAVIVVRRRSA